MNPDDCNKCGGGPCHGEHYPYKPHSPSDAGVNYRESEIAKDLFKVEVSPRIDWCGACRKEHGFDCPLDEVQPPLTESWAEKMGNLDNISDDYRGDPPDWQRRFQKEYRRAYEGILPEEELVKGNPWFEDFIRTERESYQKELVERTQSVNTHNKSGNDILIEVAEIIRSLN